MIRIPGLDITNARNTTNAIGTIKGTEEWCLIQDAIMRRRDVPDSIVTASIGNTGGVAILHNVTMDALHKEIGRENAIDEVSSYVAVVEVVLEQRRYLCA